MNMINYMAEKRVEKWVVAFKHIRGNEEMYMGHVDNPVVDCYLDAQMFDRKSTATKAITAMRIGKSYTNIKVRPILITGMIPNCEENADLFTDAKEHFSLDDIKTNFNTSNGGEVLDEALNKPHPETVSFREDVDMAQVIPALAAISEKIKGVKISFSNTDILLSDKDGKQLFRICQPKV